MSDSVGPHRWQPTRLCHPWDSPGKNTGVGCHSLFQCMKVKSESEVTQSCPTFHDTINCSLPGSSVHGIFQARVLERVAIAFSRQITSKEIKSVIKNYPTNKSVGLEDFTTELYQICKVLIPRILKLFWEIEGEEMLPNSFHKDSIILILKPDEDATRKKFLHFWKYH